MNWLKKFQTTDQSNIFLKIAQLIIFHNLSRLIFFSLFIIVGGIGMEHSNLMIWQWILGIGLVYCTLFFLVMITYALIINPAIFLINYFKKMKNK